MKEPQSRSRFIVGLGRIEELQRVSECLLSPVWDSASNERFIDPTADLTASVSPFEIRDTGVPFG